MVMEDHGMQPHQLCMVGDRMDTDVLFGHGGGLQTLLVLSGASSKDNVLESCAEVVLPDFYALSIADLQANAV